LLFNISKGIVARVKAEIDNVEGRTLSTCGNQWKKKTLFAVSSSFRAKEEGLTDKTTAVLCAQGLLLFF